MNEITITKELLEMLLGTAISFGSACGTCFGPLLFFVIYFGVHFVFEIVFEVIEKHKNKKGVCKDE